VRGSAHFERVRVRVNMLCHFHGGQTDPAIYIIYVCVIIQRAMFTRSLTAGRWSLTFRNAEREVYKTELPLPMDLREAASKLTCVGQSEESSSHKICKMFGEDAVPLRNSRKRCHVAFHASICNRFLPMF
jgi:hypothetical protein